MKKILIVLLVVAIALGSFAVAFAISEKINTTPSPHTVELGDVELGSMRYARFEGSPEVVEFGFFLENRFLKPNTKYYMLWTIDDGILSDESADFRLVDVNGVQKPAVYHRHYIDDADSTYATRIYPTEDDINDLLTCGYGEGRYFVTGDTGSRDFLSFFVAEYVSDVQSAELAARLSSYITKLKLVEVIE